MILSAQSVLDFLVLVNVSVSVIHEYRLDLRKHESFQIPAGYKLSQASVKPLFVVFPKHSKTFVPYTAMFLRMTLHRDLCT